MRDIVDRLMGNKYRTKLVRRVYIDKGNGKKRPLGIPALVDKLVQKAVALILEAIYEADFIEDSFGYRPKRDAKGAIKKLTSLLQSRNFNFIVEADIKGYFENIQHDMLIKMLELRIDDRRFIKLIRKWLRAGILDVDGKIINPYTGTPQGGIVSPILANIYLHYALDIWFEEFVKTRCKGRAFLIRIIR